MITTTRPALVYTIGFFILPIFGTKNDYGDYGIPFWVMHGIRERAVVAIPSLGTDC